jgi:hypothetical protein
MLTRYKGQLKLKDWAFAIAQRINDAQGAGRSGSPPRDHHPRDAAGRNRVRIGISPCNLRDRKPNPAPARSDAGGRQQTTARILLHGPTDGRLRFQPSRLAPSLHHQAPNERGERRHPQSVDTQKSLSPLTHVCQRPRRVCARSRHSRGPTGSSELITKAAEKAGAIAEAGMRHDLQEHRPVSATQSTSVIFEPN